MENIEEHPDSKRHSFADFDYIVKVMLLGGAGVGKTALIFQYLKSAFPEDLKSTLGFDIGVKSIESSEKVIVKLQIWDTAGQERFRAMTERNFKGVDCFVLVYDITQRDSIKEAVEYLAKVQSVCPESLKVLCANKVDLEEKRQITREEGMKMAEHYGLRHFEVSAKETPLKVQEVFSFLADETAKKFKENPKLSSHQKWEKTTKVSIGGSSVPFEDLKKYKRRCCI